MIKKEELEAFKDEIIDKITNEIRVSSKISKIETVGVTIVTIGVSFSLFGWALRYTGYEKLGNSYLVVGVLASLVGLIILFGSQYFVRDP